MPHEVMVARRQDVQIGDNDDLGLERPWEWTVAKRTPKQRLRLRLGYLIGLYVVNVAVNTLYKATTQSQIDLLHHRIESIAFLDRNDPEIARTRKLIDAADYVSLTEAARVRASTPTSKA
jgi:hypothetical protein